MAREEAAEESGPTSDTATIFLSGSAKDLILSACDQCRQQMEEDMSNESALELICQAWLKVLARG